MMTVEQIRREPPMFNTTVSSRTRSRSENPRMGRGLYSALLGLPGARRQRARMADGDFYTRFECDFPCSQLGSSVV